MFYGAGQQAGFMPPGAGGRGVPFNQQGMMVGGMQGGRPNQFGMQGQQGGRGAQNNLQGMPPGAFGLPGQLPFGMQAGPGGFPAANLQQYQQAIAQVQAQYGGRMAAGAGGRGQAAGMQGVQGMPPQMLGGQQNARGRDGRSQFPGGPQGGRGGMAGQQGGPMAGFPQQGRGGAGVAGPGGVPQAMAGQPNPAAMMAAQAVMNVPPIEAIMAAPPGAQKQLLGEALFPKIQTMQPELSGKITGMLLEMDNAELYGL